MPHSPDKSVPPYGGSPQTSLQTLALEHLIAEPFVLTLFQRRACGFSSRS